MGCPKLYRMQHEKLMAARIYQRKYYQRYGTFTQTATLKLTAIGRDFSHRDEINLKLKAKRESIKNGIQFLESGYDKTYT